MDLVDHLAVPAEVPAEVPAWSSRQKLSDCSPGIRQTRLRAKCLGAAPRSTEAAELARGKGRIAQLDSTSWRTVARSWATTLSEKPTLHMAR